MVANIEEAIFRKLRNRLLFFVSSLYIIAYLDRINIGFAALQMNQKLGLSPETYGMGAGLFFLGYTLCEIPSTGLMKRIGVRRWLGQIMFTWGLVSAGMALVNDVRSFFLMRLSLGIAEAGFFPGMVFYLSQWFPISRRASVISGFMTSTALAGCIAAPLSGALLSLHSSRGLAGWQWLFILEGLPASVLGIVAFFYLPERVDDAPWLTPDERNWLMKQEYSDGRSAVTSIRSLGEAFRSRSVWLLSLAYCSIIFGLYGVGFWLPQIIKEVTHSSIQMASIWTGIPYLLSSIAMVLIGRHSDLRRERRLHIAIPLGVAACGFLVCACLRSPAVTMIAISAAAAGIWSSLGPFWTFSASYLSRKAAAGTISLINSIGNIGGFLAPWFLGLLYARTMTFQLPLIALAGAASLAIVIVAALDRH